MDYFRNDEVHLNGDLMTPPSAKTHFLHIIQGDLHMNCSKKKKETLAPGLIHRLGSANIVQKRQAVKRPANICCVSCEAQ